MTVTFCFRNKYQNILYKVIGEIMDNKRIFLQFALRNRAKYQTKFDPVQYRSLISAKKITFNV